MLRFQVNVFASLPLHPSPEPVTAPSDAILTTHTEIATDIYLSSLLPHLSSPSHLPLPAATQFPGPSSQRARRVAVETGCFCAASFRGLA